MARVALHGPAGQAGRSSRGFAGTAGSSDRQHSPQRLRRLLLSMIAMCAVFVAVPASAAENRAGAPLTKAEATTIANRYFSEKIAIEAVVGEPTLQGDDWVFPLRVGYANRPARDPIVVNRLTGEASWGGLADLNAIRGGSKPPSR